MTTQEPEESGPHRLQTIIDHLTQIQVGRPIDETVEQVTVALRAANIEAPSSSWIDAVARAAIQGHPYIVSGTTQLESAGVHLGSPLEDAPATIEATPIIPTESPPGITPDASDSPTSTPPSARRCPTRDADPPRRITNDERRQAAVVVAVFLTFGAAWALCRRTRRPESRSTASWGVQHRMQQRPQPGQPCDTTTREHRHRWASRGPFCRRATGRHG